jgi:hypothetical protein
MLQRRGTAAEWAASNPVLGDGEIGWERDTGVVKIGNGTTAWNALTNVYRKFVDAVAKAGDTMTGPLTISKADATDALRIQGSTKTLYIRPKASGGLEFVNNAYSAVIATLGDDGAINTSGQISEAGQRVYSPNNPQPATNPFSIVDAAEDLIVGSANDTVKRLGKGTNGQVLSVVGGILTWTTPADATAKVDKAGDTMTGTLRFENQTGIRLRGQAGDNAEDAMFWKPPGAALLKFTKADGTTRLGVDFGAVWDSGNRVYSASNPPPVSGMSVLATAEPNLTTTSASVVTFVAPSNGRVKITLTHLSSGNYSTPMVSLDNSSWKATSYTAQAGTGSPAVVYRIPNAVGFVGYSGLTPGATYTVYGKDVSATDSYNLIVEG